jgi:transcriptional regulator with XRE-family HTH domain
VRDARQASRKSIEDCAHAIGVSAEIFEEYELGGKSPSLPELEVLASSLNVPLDHFWSDKTLSTQEGDLRNPDLDQLVILRQHTIGAMIRKARLEAGLSLDELAEKAWSSASLLEDYEFGDAPIPLPDLEVLANVLNLPLQDLQNRNGPLGVSSTKQSAVEDFLALPHELQAFVGKPVNRPYLELAQRLSEMSVEKLRAVAEGLLEITL